MVRIGSKWVKTNTGEIFIAVKSEIPNECPPGYTTSFKEKDCGTFHTFTLRQIKNSFLPISFGEEIFYPERVAHVR